MRDISEALKDFPHGFCSRIRMGRRMGAGFAYHLQAHKVAHLPPLRRPRYPSQAFPAYPNSNELYQEQSSGAYVHFGRKWACAALFRQTSSVSRKHSYQSLPSNARKR